MPVDKEDPRENEQEADSGPGAQVFAEQEKGG